jgi:8-oxo-dGTP pyrophosphatase MutT (NUDIX family)
MQSSQYHDRRPGGRQEIPRPNAWRPGASPPWRAVDAAPSAAAVAAALHQWSSRRVDAAHPPTFPGARASAVLLALSDGPTGAEVLLTKRSQHLTNHRGEISFPGGRVDQGESFEQTALREADEEVSLPPHRLDVVGRLDPLSTVVSRSYIVPIVATVSGERPGLQAAAAEVDRIMWVPLAELTRTDTYREEWWGSAPLERPMFFFHLDDETVWGATARILHQLLRVSRGLAW